MKTQLFLVKCGALAMVVAIVFGLAPAIRQIGVNAAAETTAQQTLTKRLDLAAHVAKGVRTFGSSDGLELVPCLARDRGFSVIAATAYLNGDPKNDASQIDALRANAVKGCVTIAVLGTNPTTSGRSVEQVIRDINAFKQSLADKGVTNVQVTTSERFEVYRDNPSLVQAVDLVFVTLEPFFEGPSTGVNVKVTPAQGVQRVQAAYAWFQKQYPAKTIVIGETGWPTSGPDERATTANAQAYLRSLLLWSVEARAPLFIYSLVDEPDLAKFDANLAHFGLSADGVNVKPGLETIFDRTCAVSGSALATTSAALSTTATMNCFTGVNFVSPALPVVSVPVPSKPPVIANCTLTPTTILSVLRRFGIGITNKDLSKIPVNLTGVSGPDTDGDGLPDAVEQSLGTNAKSVDTDGDSYSDRAEIEFGYSPLAGKATRMPYNTAFAKAQRGKSFLQVQSKGEAWYVSKIDARRTYGMSTDEAKSWACGK